MFDTPIAPNTERKRVLLLGDNLTIMGDLPSESVDLVYADPPFNSGRNYTGKKGSSADGAFFDDTWKWYNATQAIFGTLHFFSKPLADYIKIVRGIHSEDMASYLVFMAKRIIEMRRLLKNTGSFYLHCDTSAGHYLKIVCDIVFGKENFKNDISWCYTGPQVAKSHYPKKHDTLLFYTASDQSTFNRDAIRVPSKWNEKGGYSKEGIGRNNKGKVPEDWWHMTFGPNTKERNGYPTQKPVALLERIIKASSNEGDVVLDPFCGSGTALVAAQNLGRDWIGIDSQSKAMSVSSDRLGFCWNPTTEETENV